MGNNQEKSKKKQGEKIFFTIILVMFGWIFYQSFIYKIVGGYKRWTSPYGGIISEDIIRKYRGEIPFESYDSFSENEIDTFCFQKHLIQYPIIEECQKIGLVISDDVIKNVLLSKKKFLNEDGEFSNAKFKDHLDKWKISEADYYTLIKEDLLIKQYFYFLQNSYIVSKKILNRFNKQYNKVLRIRYGYIDHHRIEEKIKETCNFSDENLKEFFVNNRKLFANIQSAQYELYSLNDSSDNSILLNYYIQHKMKNEIINTFKAELCDISKITDISLQDTVKYYLFNIRKKNYFQLFKSSDSKKNYLLFITTPQELVEKSFEEVSLEEIKKEYLLYQAKKNADSALIEEWFYQDISADSYIIRKIPTKFVQKMFSTKINEEKKFQDSMYTYFLTVEHVSDKEEVIETDEYLKLKLDKLLKADIEAYLRNKALNEKRD